MRGLLLLFPAILLTGCVKQSSSYYINDRDHALTLRAEQQYAWKDQVRLTLTAARLPDCQRQFVLGEVPIDEVTAELFSAGGNVYNLRVGNQTWQFDTDGCSQAAVPDANALGRPLGSFVFDGSGKMVFEATAAEQAAAAEQARP